MVHTELTTSRTSECIEVPADDLAWLVQPGRQRPGLRALGDLYDPAEQGNVGAIDIASPVMYRSRCRNGHGAPPSRGFGLVTGWLPGADASGAACWSLEGWMSISRPRHHPTITACSSPMCRLCHPASFISGECKHSHHLINHPRLHNRFPRKRRHNRHPHRAVHHCHDNRRSLSLASFDGNFARHSRACCLLCDVLI